MKLANPNSALWVTYCLDTNFGQHMDAVARRAFGEEQHGIAATHPLADGICGRAGLGAALPFDEDRTLSLILKNGTATDLGTITTVGGASPAGIGLNSQGQVALPVRINGGPYTLVATSAATSQYNNTGLTSGTTYYYVVTAVNGSGQESPFSNQASGTPR